VKIQFTHDAGTVSHRGLKRDPELRGDFLTRLAVHHKRENLKFAFGEAATRPGGITRLAVGRRVDSPSIPPEGQQVFEYSQKAGSVWSKFWVMSWIIS